MTDPRTSASAEGPVRVTRAVWGGSKDPTLRLYRSMPVRVTRRPGGRVSSPRSGTNVRPTRTMPPTQRTMKARSRSVADSAA